METSTDPDGLMARSLGDDWNVGHAIGSALAAMRARVVDDAGNDVGDVADLMLDCETGRVVYLVVQVGAVLGIGGQHFALPWAVVAEVDDSGVRLRVGSERVQSAPPVELAFWPGMASDARWARAVHEHFGATPYWVGHGRGRRSRSGVAGP